MKKLNLRALAAGLAASVAMTCLSGVPAFAAAQKVGEAAKAEMPTRVQAIEALERANDKWITSNRNHGRSFWDNAAYHVGNMEAYFTTGIELYRNYSEAWAMQNNWKGATSTNKSAWKGNASNGGYGEGQDWVLFGDWQICFQTYIDLYNDEYMASKGAIKDDGKVARALEVMSYQMYRSEIDWWWWADSLFMAMPIMSKLYVLTGDYQYLDKQYEWFKWAAEDVEGGTKDGMWDTEEQLFHRDGKYIYPDHKTDNGKKDFWARGSGWVFAGLARVLSDMPTDYEHRDYFLDKYTQMAQGVARNQQEEGFWSRSILDRAHADGFESSGTSFFTYGLAWGINSGYLDRDTYLDTALKGWYFLYNTALQADGTVGYVQPIGENSKQSLNIGGGNTANFGVGAFLLAASEISKLAGGVRGDQTDNNDIYPYIMRKLVGKYVLEVNTAHFYHDGIINHHDENNHNMQTYYKDNTVMLPVIAIKNYMPNCDVTEDSDTVYVTRDIKNGSNTTRKTVVFTMGSADYTVDGAAGVLPTAAERKDGYACVPVRQVMEGLGYKIWFSAYSGTSEYVANNPMDALVVISEKVDPFFDCDANAVEMLRWMLEVNHHYPERPTQSPKNYTVEKPMQAATEAYGIQVPLTTSMLTASATPEAQNNVNQTIDNNVETRWAAQGSQHMDIDLGVPMQIACVGVRMMRYTDGRVINYGVQVSSDNTNWTSVFNGTSVPNGATWEFPKVDGKVARYIRINVNGSSTGDWASVADVAVFQGDANSPKASGVTGSGAGGAVTQQVTTSATGTKVSLNANMVKASAEPEAQNPGRNAVDGNAGTVWAAEGNANLVIDLGSSAVVSSVGVQMKLYEDTRTVNYGVEVSENGSSYTSYFSGACAPGGGVMEYIPVAANARYVRINVNGNSISNWASVAEVEVYTGGTAKPATGQVQQGVGPVVTPGGKIALNGGMAKASAEPEAANPGRNAVDGNPDTFWAAEGSQNLVIDLGSAQTIATVGVQMRRYTDNPGRALPYTVSVSTDGSSYTSVASQTSAAGGGVMETVTVGQTARYIKIDVNGSNEGSWASLAEVEVYGGTVSGGTAGAFTGGGLSSISSKPVGNRVTLKSANTMILADEKFPASATVDKDKNTYWKGLANQSVVVELANEKTVTSVGVCGIDADPLNYSISVSADGSNWTPVYSGAGVGGVTAYHPCEAKGKYVMVTLAGEGKVAEVEVYGAE